MANEKVKPMPPSNFEMSNGPKKSILGDIEDPRWLYFKGALFFLLGIFATALLVWQVPEPSLLLLHGIAIWAFARAYYFAFYVIQYYVDPKYRFSGLFAFAKYLASSKTSQQSSDDVQI